MQWVRSLRSIIYSSRERSPSRQPRRGRITRSLPST